VAEKNLMDQALKFLSQKAYTRNKLAARLLRAGYDEAEIAKCLERLIGWGYLNDRDFAVNKVKSLIAGLKSKLYIRNYLAEQGLAASLITELLDEYYPDELEVTIARQLLERNRKSSGGKKTPGWAALARAGFTEETVGKCLNNGSPT